MFDLTTIPLPLLIAGVLIAFVMVVAQLARLRWALMVIAGMFFVSVVSVSHSAAGTPIYQWLYPVQSNRSTLFLALGGLLAINILGHVSAIQSVNKSPQGIVLMLIGFYAGLLRVVHESAASGAQSLIFAVFTIGSLVWVLPALLRNWDDIIRILRLILYTNVAWIGCVIVQFAINPGSLSKGRAGRFYGLLGNAQHAAVFVGICAAIALWMFLNDPRRRYRILWMMLIAVNIVLLFWSGSRTGMGMVVIGMGVAAYGRLGRSALLFPVAGVLVIGAYQAMVALGIDLIGTAERLTSTDDTRSGAWLTMIESGFSSPIIGVGIEDAGDTENSYLFGFAAYGLGMVALIGVLMLVSLRICYQLFRLRSRVAIAQRSLIDLVLGYNVMYFAGGMLEGYMMARVAGNLVLLTVFGTIGTRILTLAAEDAWEEEWDEQAAWSGDDEAEPSADYDGYGDGFEPA